MNWAVQNQFFIFSGLLILGFAVIGIFLLRINRKVRILFGETAATETEFQQNLARRVARIEAKIEEIDPRLELLEGISKLGIRKVGFLRFNPFHDTGGDNSFVLALLDEKNDGVLISSLYARGGVRVYGKPIEGGDSRYPLSKEEKGVVEEAMAHNGLASKGERPSR